MAAVIAAKLAKYLWSVLHELGFGQSKPTALYVDNQAAITMVNERKPTPCSSHIHIQHFAIQEWRAAGDIELHHIPGTINTSDQATKALPPLYYSLLSHSMFYNPWNSQPWIQGGCCCTRVQWVMVGNISHKCGHVHWTISSTSCLKQIFHTDIDNCQTKVVTFLVCSLIVRVNYWMNCCCPHICSSGYCSTWV